MKINPKKILLEVESTISDAKKILWVIGRHAFLVILVLVLMDILYGGFLYYKYAYLSEKEDPKINSVNSKFNADTYQKIIDQWQERDQKLQQFLQKDYLSPF